MEKAAALRLEAKSPENQFLYELENGFELSPREAEGILLTAKTILGQKPELKTGIERVIAVSVKEPAGKQIQELKKVEIVVTRDASKEDLEVLKEHGKVWLRCTRILRMTEEAIEQEAVLSEEDLSKILGVDVRTIRRDIKLLRDVGFIVNTRGFYKGIGKGISHKSKIVELYLKGLTYAEIMRRSRHSLGAIKRYIVTFGRAISARQRGIRRQEDIAYLVGISPKLASEYLELYKQYKDKAKEEIDSLVYFNKIPPFEDEDRRKKGYLR